MNRKFRYLLLVVVALLSSLLLLGACSKSQAQATRYHCPMHPTYVSDRPGDCPICGMRLVPINDQEHASSVGEHRAAEPAHPPPNTSGAPDKTLWTCPMHPEVVSDRPGRCPKCGMNLEPKAVPGGAPSSSAVSASREQKVLYYRNPMDPKVTSPVPAKDSMGMDFVPVYSDQVAGSESAVPGLAPIDVSPEGLRLAGVRTALAEQSHIDRTIRAVGIVRGDETRVRHVHTKISGWIEKLYVNSAGEPVAKERPILSIYSQELLAAQQEYLQAKSAASSLEKSSFQAARQGASDMLEAARRRLQLFDVPQGFIAELDRTGVTRRTVTLSAPVGGIVMSKSAFEGQQVEPGMELFTVSDLSQVWIEADVYESEASAVHVGQEGTITFPQDPSTAMRGRIKYIYPYLNPDTRTLRVRFTFPNPAYKLKLDSYVNVEIPVQSGQGAVVPDSAIMDTGLRQVVFVSPREGRFEPRLVKVGIRADGKAQIVSGLKVGERVAVKANFLLDSESRLRAAMAGPAVSPPPPATSEQPPPASPAASVSPAPAHTHP